MTSFKKIKNQYGLTKTNEEVFIAGSNYARHNLKRRILTENMIPYQCACCGIEAEWQGKPMPLILDHVNGINNDNRLENLRFVCSNCDTQLPTYKNKRGKTGNVAERPNAPDLKSGDS